MYGLIGVSSWAQYIAFFEHRKKEKLFEIKTSSIQLLSGPSVDNKEDVLSVNLRAKGLKDEEIAKQLALAQRLEEAADGAIDVSTRLTGNDEIDLVQICDKLRSLGIPLEYK